MGKFQMIDSSSAGPLQREAMKDEARRTGVIDAADHRPGFRYGDTFARDATIDAYFLKDQEDAAAWVGDKPGGRLVERQRTNVRDRKEAAHDTRDAATIQKDHAQAMAALYDAHDREQAEAWRGNPSSGAGSGEFRGAQEGDICTVRGLDFPDDFGSPGHLRMRNGRLECVPDKPQSARKHDHATTMDEVYRAYDLEISQRWRTP
jgi:hypothetical protein